MTVAPAASSSHFHPEHHVLLRPILRNQPMNAAGGSAVLMTVARRLAQGVRPAVFEG